MNGEPKPPEPLQLLRSWGCPGACHGLWQCSLEDLPEKTVQEDAPLLLENHALPPTPLSGSTSLDHFALIVLQLPGRREAPAVNLARTICSAPRKLQGKWLCEYSKNNNRSICLGSCASSVAHNTKGGMGAAIEQAWFAPNLSYALCFPGIRLFSTVFLNWMRATELY